MKTQCVHQSEVERWFDGEAKDASSKDASSKYASSVESHVASCESCRRHLAFLKECRAAIEAMPASPVISDVQMSAFLEGISEGVHRPRRGLTGIWAMASAITAAVIVAISMMTIMSTGPEPVGAESEIETVSTEIDGATVEIIEDDDETPTVWLHLPEGGEI